MGMKEVRELKEKWAPNRVYDWFQGTEDGVKFTGGVCAMMTMDWLRRKYFERKNFNHHSYSTSKDPGNFSFMSKASDFFFSESNPKRSQVVGRAVELQSLYSKIWADYNEKISHWVSEFQSANKRAPTMPEMTLWNPQAAAFKQNGSQQVWEDMKVRLSGAGKFKGPKTGFERKGENRGKGLLPRGFESLSGADQEVHAGSLG